MKPKLDEIITRIGADVFAEACQAAQMDAPGTGKCGKESWDTPGFVLDIENWLHDDTSLTPSQRIALLFALYERMPCYALLMTGPKWCAEDCPIARRLWEVKVRELLGAEQDALADPIGYWLWCGPFEDMGEVEPWWHVCAAPGGPPRLYERLLKHSGPVPYDLKAELYDRLLPDERWHLYIYRSLNASQGDIYGQIDIERATELYDRLVLPPDAE
jgi:hypothetical protein